MPDARRALRALSVTRAGPVAPTVGLRPGSEPAGQTTAGPGRPTLQLFHLCFLSLRCRRLAIGSTTETWTENWHMAEERMW
jgi:hypothetical protein